MSAPYQVPAAELAVETEIKKSRFIALAKHTASRSEAMAFLETTKEQHPDARHHCWAYLIGSPHSPTTVAMSDDGEPSGTAGKPILNVLQHKHIGDITVIVVRYFGGIKLGAGGLVRAYSNATQSVISALPTLIKFCLIHKTVICDFHNEQSLRHWLHTHGGKVVEINYRERVEMTVAIDETDLCLFETFARSVNATIDEA